MGMFLFILAMIGFTLLMNSYLIAGLMMMSVLSLNAFYGYGGMTTFLTIVLFLIIARFIGKRKRRARMEKEMYRAGREFGHWGKFFDRGYDDEYNR